MEKTREFQELMTIEGKLAELLAAYNLVYTFSSDDYPISLTVEPNLDPSAQMEMFSNDDAGVSSRTHKRGLHHERIDQATHPIH